MSYLLFVFLLDILEIDLPTFKYIKKVKSGLILAALNTEGVSKFIEKDITRDHTEIMLESFGADIDIKEENKYKVIEGLKE